MLPRRGLGNNNRPATGEVKVVDTEVRRAAELVVGNVVVHDNVAVRDRVVEDALATRGVHVVVRAEHERARRRVQVRRDRVPELAIERSARARAAPDEDLVLPARRRALGSLCERRIVSTVLR